MTAFDAHLKGLVTTCACDLVFGLIAIPLVLRKIPRNGAYGFRTPMNLINRVAAAALALGTLGLAAGYGTAVLAQDATIKSVAFKCTGTRNNPGRVIKDPDDMKPPKILSKGDPAKLYQVISEKAAVGKLVFEVLIDETGAIECVQLVENANQKPEVVDAFIQNIKQCRYEPPQDKGGKVVACHWLITANLAPEGQ